MCTSWYETYRVDADDKLLALSPLSISRVRRKQVEEDANSVDLSAYRSSTGCIGWIGVAASPFSSLASSVLQQKVPGLKVKDLISQVNHLKMLHSLGTVITNKRLIEKGEYEMSIVVFSDANRHDSCRKIGFIAGLVVGEFKSGSPLYTLTWSSRKSRRPVRSIGSAETIAASIAIDEGKIISKSVIALLGTGQSYVSVLIQKIYWTLSRRVMSLLISLLRQTSTLFVTSLRLIMLPL